VPAPDFLLHNSLFLIAHFHNVIIGGVVFGAFAAINYWFPKAFGFKLDRKWGLASFWFWFIGFWTTFTPLYIAGFMGVTRRMSHFDDPALQFWFQISLVGAVLIALGIACFFIQIGVSFLNRKKLADVTGDPGDARTLEWSTSSPPPDYNFAFTPVVHDIDAWHDMKKHGYKRPTEGFLAVHMPKNTGAGFIIAAISAVVGFALIWHMWLLAGLAFIGLIAAAIIHTFNYDRDYHIPVEEVIAIESERTRLLASHV